MPVRIEIGPQDVAKGNCVVARAAGEPGTVAERTTIKMSKALVRHVRQALQDAGVAIERPKPAAATEVLSEPAAGGVGEQAAASEDEEEEEDSEGEGHAGVSGSKPSHAAAGDGHGDDMDDFHIEDVWVEPEEQVSASA